MSHEPDPTVTVFRDKVIVLAKTGDNLEDYFVQWTGDNTEIVATLFTANAAPTLPVDL